MAEKNEIMNIMDYEVVDTRSNDMMPGSKAPTIEP